MLTCGAWVKRGVAKEEPDQVKLTADDIKHLLQETKEKIKDVENGDINPDDLEEEEEKIMNRKKEYDEEIESDSDEAIRAEYGLDNYDEEGAVMTGAGMAGLMYFASNEDDPYVDMKDTDEDDKEDFIIKKDDNLFVVGKMEEEFSCLEIYVYNEDEDSLYVHHDILLESFPLCVEWMSYCPTDEKSGNYMAVGTMEPDIQVWDLDIVDTIEPAFVLAGKKKRKKKKKETLATVCRGHEDAVLGLSWNQSVRNVMASSSADKTVVLWDISKCTCVHKLKHHTDKVQSVKWHPYEAQSLLTGSFDKTASVLDCRSPQAVKSWSLTGECEQITWDHFAPYCFFVSSDDGVVCYCDVRTEKPVFTLHAHDGAVTGMAVSTEVANCLTTVSSDKILKVWDYEDNQPLCVLSREMKMGNLNFICACPDISLTYAVGGEKDGVRILNVLETTQGKQHFQSKRNRKVKTEVMDTEGTAVDALATLSLNNTDSTSNGNEIKRKKKKKKK